MQTSILPAPAGRRRIAGKFELAGLGTRFGAKFLDNIILGIVNVVLSFGNHRRPQQAPSRRQPWQHNWCWDGGK